MGNGSSSASKDPSVLHKQDPNLVTTTTLVSKMNPSEHSSSTSSLRLVAASHENASESTLVRKSSTSNATEVTKIISFEQGDEDNTTASTGNENQNPNITTSNKSSKSSKKKKAKKSKKVNLNKDKTSDSASPQPESDSNKDQTSTGSPKLKSLNAIKESLQQPEMERLSTTEPEIDNTESLLSEQVNRALEDEDDPDMEDSETEEPSSSITALSGTLNAIFGSQQAHDQKFHRSNPQWKFDFDAPHTHKSLPQTMQEFCQYTWQGMQQVREDLWIIEALRESDSSNMTVLLQLDPSGEKSLSMRGMLCLFGKRLGIRMPQVLLVDSSNEKDFQFVLNEIEAVAGSSLGSVAKSSESLLVFEYIPDAQPLSAQVFQDNIDHAAFRESLVNTIAFDILVNNQSHIPCLVDTMGHPDNLVVSQSSHELLPVENKTIMLSSPQDIESYCDNVERFISTNPSTRAQNLEEKLQRFLSHHMNIERVSSSHMRHICECFNQTLQRFSSLDEEMQDIFDEITTSFPSVATRLQPQFYLQVQKRIQKCMKER